jgi:uncharacterized protein (DUF2252 family)
MLDPDSYCTVAERREIGREARKKVKRSSHAAWEPAADRADPVAVIDRQNKTRLPDLVPVRHGRMMVSPFTFYRGAAAVMAADLAPTPVSGLTVQACGDAHLSNFGVFGSPERSLVFDCNDFDETLPGPWEWDVKRLAASFTIAARHNKFDAAATDTVTRRAVGAYREAMAQFAGMGATAIWATHLDAESLVQYAPDGKERDRVERQLAKARTRTSLHAFDKLVEQVDGEYRIRSLPPVLVPLRDRAEWSDDTVRHEVVHEALAQYLKSVPDDLDVLLSDYRPVDVALKVVGVGSVGTRCLILLMLGRDESDPLFLQVKEAGRSVLEEHLPKSRYRNHGQRVVEGQKLMQAASDPFLGWAKGPTSVKTHFYWRQLRDMKGSAIVDSTTPERLTQYAQVCGWTLARAHARSGDPIAIAAYLGNSDTFDQAIGAFSSAYADQNERDYKAFKRAIKEGRIEAEAGV